MDLLHHRLYSVASLLFLLHPLTTSFCAVSFFFFISPTSRRINIGQKYQAEIPELRDQLSSQLDHHKADLVWLPLDDSHLSASEQHRSKCRYRISSHSHTLCCSFPLDLLLLSPSPLSFFFFFWMNSPKLCHRFLLISGRLDEHGLFQCTQGGRNQPGTGSTLFTRVRRRFSCEYDSPLGRDRTAAWLHAQSCPLENCSRLAGKLQL